MSVREVPTACKRWHAVPHGSSRQVSFGVCSCRLIDVKRFHLLTMKSKKISSASAKSAGPERGQVMNGAEILVSCLEREGVHIGFRLSRRRLDADSPGVDQIEEDPRGAAPARAGRRVCRGRLCARHGQGRRLHGDIGPGRDESRHRHRRRLHGFRSAGGDHRPGATRT